MANYLSLNYYSSIISQPNNLYKKKNISIIIMKQTNLVNRNECFVQSCFRPSLCLVKRRMKRRISVFYSKGRRAEKWHTSKSWTSSTLIMRSPLPECGKNRKRNRWRQRDFIGNLLLSTLFLKGESALLKSHQNLVHHATELGAFYF